MPVFEYHALDRRGKKVKGLITADGPSSARLRLSQGTIFPTDIREVKETVPESAGTSFFPQALSFQRIKPVEITTALRQLATLLSSGLPLLDCLDGVIEQTERPRLKRIFSQIRERVVEGKALYSAMGEHPGLFSKVYVNMVKAGESGGALDIILKRLADFSEKSLRLRKKIESAMAYPIFLFVVSIIILIFMLSFVMPKVIGIFEGMDLILPWPTRFLIGATNIMKEFWWLIGAGLIAVIGFLTAWFKSENGSMVWDRIRLHAPFFGRIHQKAVISRFCRTLSILLKSGLPLVDALDIAKLSMGNQIMEKCIGDTAQRVGEGADFAGPLKRTGQFPPMVVQLVRAGEQSGELEEMLAKAASMYEEDMESTITSLTAVIEPILILAMGLAVAFMILAILMPIFDMTGGIR
jgi:general secretion pathway protein F